jgi:hypothetical protein
MDFNYLRVSGVPVGSLSNKQDIGSITFALACYLKWRNQRLPVTIRANSMLFGGVMELEPRSLHAERVCRTALSEDDKIEFEAYQVSFGARVVLAAGYTHSVFLHPIDLLQSLATALEPLFKGVNVTKKDPVRGDAVAISAGARRHRVTQRRRAAR